MSKIQALLVVAVFAAAPVFAMGTWTQMTVAEGYNLTGVDYVAEDLAWAVGQNGVILRFDGVTWERMESPTDADLKAVVQEAPDSVWAVGLSGTILHFDGTEWTLDPDVDPDYSLSDVALDPGGNLFACGSEMFSWKGIILGYRDGEWTLFDDRPASVRRLSLPAELEIWAVGAGDMIHHYSMGAWTTTNTGTGDTLFDVAALASDLVWVTGTSFSNGRRHIFHFDGTEWTVQHEGWNDYLAAVSMADARHGFVVGEVGTILRWDGEEWTQAPSMTRHTLHDVDMLGPYRALAVGSTGSIYHFTQPSIAISTNQQRYRAGDRFLLQVTLDNPGAQLTTDMYVVLDVFGDYFFYPSWSETVDFETRILPEASSTTIDLLEFLWPSGAGSADGLRFWAAVTLQGTTELAAEVDSTEFGFE
jgi:photosystem II stability/assembly factor-like uncharacterized protein